MPGVLLATSREWAAGEPGHEALEDELRRRGIDHRWARWDDPDVDWAGSLVALRSTWDYATRAPEFLAWTRTLPWVLNGADVFEWNHDKTYLVDLADDVPAVPTRLASTVEELSAAVRELGATVVKPRVGAGGAGVLVTDDPDDERLGTTFSGHPELEPVGGPWVCQPLVESVRTTGETSVFVLDGRVVAQVDKLPAGGEIRVHEHFGGSSRPVAVADDAAALANDAIEVVGRRFGRPCDYGRVDMMRHEGRWVVSELELIEPGLYLDVLPGNAVPFVDLVAARLARGREGPAAG